MGLQMKRVHKLLIIFAATVLAFVFSAFAQILLVPVLALAAFLAVEWGAAYLAPVLIAVAAGAFLPGDFSAGAIVSVVYLWLIPIILVVYGKKRFPHRYAALALAVVITLGTYLSLTLGSMLRGLPPYAETVDEWAVMVDGYAEVFNGVYGSEDMLEMLTYFESLIPDLLMPYSVLTGEFFAFMLVIFYRLWSKLFKVEPQEMARFSEWRLPKNMHWGSLILVVVIAVVYIARFERAAGIGLSLGLMVIPLFAAQGLAFFLALFSATKAPAGLRVLLFVFTVLLFPYSMLLLAFFGLREQLQNRRRIMKEYLASADQARLLRKDRDEYEKYGYIRRDEEEKKDKDKNESNDSQEDK